MTRLPPEHRSPDRQACNAFIVVYLLDSLLAALDEIGAWALGLHPLGFARNPVSLLALTLAVVIYGWMALSPRLPRLVLVPPVLVLFWIGLGTLPWGVTAPARAGRIAAAALGAGALWLLLLTRRASRGGVLLDEAAVAGPTFRFWPSARFVATNLILAPPCLALLLVLTVTGYIENESRGFVTFDRTGVNLADRSYARDDRVIRLVGMMHIGEGQGYRDIVGSFPSVNTVILTEGVSDRKRLLERFGYDGVAQGLGLDVQPRIDETLSDLHGEDDQPCPEDEHARPWPHVETADIDVAEFAPSTVELLNRVGKVWTAPDLQAGLLELLSLSRDPRAEQWSRQFQTDVIERRNEHLLGAIEVALPRYTTVVVPWGGLHLPGIERGLLARGFVLRETSSRRLLRYRTVLDALAAR